MRGIGSQNSSSPFRTNQATSGDTDILEMRSSSTPRLSSSSMNNRDFSVDVIQTAAAQRNEGEALNSSALATASGFTVGEHRMSINVGDRQFDFNFTVSATDTNRNVRIK